MAHEIGHLLGSNHAAFGKFEYGNPYSLMGGGRTLMQHDYEVVGKAMFQWIHGKKQIQWFGHTRHAACARTEDNLCTVLSTNQKMTVWLHPHDSGVPFNSENTYAIKLTLTDPGYYLWIETRVLVAALLKKALLTWSGESWPIPDGGSSQSR